MANSGLSDNKAFLGATGNLTMGKSFSDVPVGNNDDGKGDTTYPYAKNDVEFMVHPAQLIGDTLPALTYDSVATTVAMRTLAASTTHKVIVPFPAHFLRTYSTIPHGILVNSVSLVYRVNTTTLTSATMALETLALAAAASFTAASAPAGAVTGNTLTTAANLYEMKFTPTTPAWVTTTGTMTYALATIVVPGSSTCDLTGAIWRCSVGFY